MPDVDLPDPEDLEEKKGKTFTRRVALVTAVYAVVLAISSLGGGNATKDMMLAQQSAADQWAFYQAKAIRGFEAHLHRQRLDLDLAERGGSMTEEVRQKADALLAHFAEEEERYNREKEEIKKQAEAAEQDRNRNRAKDPYFDYAAVMLQIAIVMSSISILSSSRHLFALSAVLAALGTILTVIGFLL